MPLFGLFGPPNIKKLESDRNLDGLVRAFQKTDDPETRKLAVEAVARISGPGAIEPLISALKNDGPNVREAAAKGLGRIGGSQVIIPLMRAMADEVYRVSTAARAALASNASPDVVNALMAALGSTEWRTREAAAALLGELKVTAAAPRLVEAAQKDDHAEVRSQAAIALSQIQDPAAVDTLVACLSHDPDALVRRTSARMLCQSTDLLVTNALLAALKDRDGEVRAIALEHVGEIRPAEAVPVLIEALKDEEENVRACAAEALGNIGDRSALRPLLDVFDDFDLKIGKQHWYYAPNTAKLISAVGHFKDDRAVYVLSKQLKSSDKTILEATASALGEIGSKSALQALKSTLEDEHTARRMIVATVLEKIGKGLNHTVSVVVFRVGDDQPLEPELYCQKLVQDFYGSERVMLQQWRIIGVQKPLENGASAHSLYEALQREGRVPRWGKTNECCQREGSDGRAVTALFFHKFM